MLSDRLKSSGCTTWLVNTGYMRAPSETRKRIPFRLTKSLISRIIDGHYNAEFSIDPVFNFSVPIALLREVGLNINVSYPNIEQTEGARRLHADIQEIARGRRS
jgi:ATP-dependent phosphoenolpyruvate carboxykinase